MAEPVVLSGSSLNTYLRCAHRWELEYVRAIKRPPSLKMALGVSAHEAAELDMAQKVQTGQDLPLEPVLDAFRDSFIETARESTEIPEKKETRTLMMASGLAAVTTWHRDVAPLVQPASVEAPIQFTINDVPYGGTIDVIDTSYLIRDWKFVGKKPSSGVDYAYNMTGYAIGFRQQHPGMTETGVVLDHVVRTLKPYHFPIASDGPVPDESILGFAEAVTETHARISEGYFPPTGLRTRACSWCPYADGTCKPHREAQGRSTR
jgi:hypothetical protein